MRFTIFRRLLIMGIIYIVSITLAVCVGMYLFARHSMFETIGHEARIVAAFSTNVTDDIEAWKQLQERQGNALRLTIVDPSGAVLYESERSMAGMDNHSSRPEVDQAFTDGESFGERVSATMGVSTYYYAVKAPNGYVIRVATEASGLQRYLYGGFFVALVLAALYMLGLYCVARRMSLDIVKPIEVAFTGWTHKRGNRVLHHLSQTHVELDPLIKTLEKQQDELNDYISSETKRRREFSANIAHELKTPLTTISGYAELLKSGYVQTTEEAAALGEKVYSASQRMLVTIESILHLSEIESHMWKDRLSSVNLTNIWMQAWRMIQEKHPNANITFEIKGSAPAVEGHPSLLLEVATNLLDNAVKYSKISAPNNGSNGVNSFNDSNNGTGAAEMATVEGINANDASSLIGVPNEDIHNHIVLTLSIDHGYSKMVLSDTGIGIPVAKVNRIFERFYRVDPSRAQKVVGTGIGLALVKHIVDVHKGTIDVQSVEGQGATFTVELPFVVK